eukprot:Skav228978  [mRNA]  locus=scaffold671:258922:260674:- [translate_table: standard]
MKATTYLADDDDPEDYDDAQWEDDENFFGDEEEPPVDYEEDYYYHGEGDLPDPVYDVTEYDDIFASYVDAKNQLNKMRQSRGFYPVVAMDKTDEDAMEAKEEPTPTSAALESPSPDSADPHQRWMQTERPNKKLDPRTIPTPPAPEGGESSLSTTDPVASAKSASHTSDGDSYRRLVPQRLRKMIYEAEFLVKEHRKLLMQSKNPPRKTHVVWEVYAGRGRLTDCVNGMPHCRAERFGPAEGWDFSRPADRRLFLRRLREEEPDDIHMSPECRLWSPLQ